MNTLDIELTDIAHGGSCVGRAEDGRVVFARFGLPGEKVRVSVTNERSTMINADVVEVLANPSPHRVETAWPEAGPLGVGGAELGHVAFDYQKDWKTHVLTSTIHRVGGKELAEHFEERGILASVRALESDAATGGWNTRTRVEFVVDDSGTPAMYREGTHDLLPVSSFPLAVRDIEDLDLFGPWRQWWSPGDRVRAVVPSGSDPVVALGESTWWAPGLPAERYVREDVVVDGSLYAYRVRAAGFWQVHREAAGELIGMTMRAAEPREGSHVTELYSGAGMLTQPLALAVGPQGSVEAIEGVAAATDDARANLRDLPWARPRTGRINARLASRIDADLVVADPPRQGLGKELASELALGPAERIVLVACDPASMARDVRAMIDAGRQVIGFESADLFPNTHHFESVVTLV